MTQHNYKNVFKKAGKYVQKIKGKYGLNKRTDSESQKRKASFLEMLI